MNDTDTIFNTTTLPTTPWAYFWQVTKPHKWWMLAAILAVICGAVLDQGISYLFKLIVDAVGSGNTSRVFWLGLAFPILLFFAQIDRKSVV